LAAHLVAHQRLGQTHADIVLAPMRGRAQAVEAEVGGRAGQEGGRACDGGFVHLGPAQPGFLHDVLGVGARAEHAIGERPQVTGVIAVVTPGTFVQRGVGAGMVAHVGFRLNVVGRLAGA